MIEAGEKKSSNKLQPGNFPLSPRGGTQEGAGSINLRKIDAKTLAWSFGDIDAAI
jgi:hypothetical protein